MDPLAEVRQLYFNATKATIQRDLARAIDLIKQIRDEDERQKAAVYMEGLAEMRSEWTAGRGGRRNPGRG